MYIVHDYKVASYVLICMTSFANNLLVIHSLTLTQWQWAVYMYKHLYVYDKPSNLRKPLKLMTFT